MPKQTCTCPSCGYEWQQGQDGTHSCVDVLRLQLAEKQELLARLVVHIKRLQDAANEVTKARVCSECGISNVVIAPGRWNGSEIHRQFCKACANKK